MASLTFRYMKRKNTIACILIFCGFAIQAQITTMEFMGTISQVDDMENVLKNAIHVGDTFTGTVLYFNNITDNNTDTTVGDYFNTQSPAGIIIQMDTLKFETDSNDIDLLVETVSRPSNKGGNAIVFRSYNNLFSTDSLVTHEDSLYNENHIGWQLDDPFGAVLNNDSLITKFDLNDFEQFFGLSIRTDNYYSRIHYLIRGQVTKLLSTVRDEENTTIEIDSSFLNPDTIRIEVDTMQESVTDFDGNTYKTVKIGEQIWMRENMRSVHYANGMPKANVHAYNDSEENAILYGRLYTWDAVMRGLSSSISIPSDIEGACPSGWHMPSDNEWYTIIKYLGRNSDAGGKMKEVGTSHWHSPNYGADDSTYLSVRPAGSLQNGNYGGLGTAAVFWSTAETSDNYARYVFLDNQSTGAVLYNGGNKASSISVRCIKGDGKVKLQANAGPDTAICVGLWGVDTTEIGRNPTAFGGSEPYTYTWSTEYLVGTTVFGASYFLDDSTSANPRIVNSGPENLKFFLKVVDNNGTQVIDSISVNFSNFVYLLTDLSANINQGDTVTLLPSIVSNTVPLSYEWTPEYNISDPSIGNPKAWPDTSVNYQVIVTDSIGCISEPAFFKVHVSPVEALSILQDDIKSAVFPNPIDNNSIVIFDYKGNDNLSIRIFNTKGQLVLYDSFSSDTFSIGKKITRTGRYLYLISNDSEVLSYGQFIKL